MRDPFLNQLHLFGVEANHIAVHLLHTVDGACAIEFGDVLAVDVDRACAERIIALLTAAFPATMTLGVVVRGTADADPLP